MTTGEVQSPRSNVQICHRPRRLTSLDQCAAGAALSSCSAAAAVGCFCSRSSLHSQRYAGSSAAVDLPLPELCTMRRMTGINCPDAGSPARLSRWLMVICVHRGCITRLESSGSWQSRSKCPTAAIQLWRIHRGLGRTSVFLGRQLTLLVVGVATLIQWAVRMMACRMARDQLVRSGRVGDRRRFPEAVRLPLADRYR